LRSLGFIRLTVFAGGWKEWQAAGLPVEVGT
jgi:3-mercaptopyruvate sulfurtransferase SseA